MVALRRKIKYITIFFLICFIILALSTVSERTILNFYALDVVQELNEVFTTKQDFNIGGNMLAIYLDRTCETFTLDGVRCDRFLGEYQYREVEKNFYNVKIENSVEGRNYIVNKTEPKNLIELESIVSLYKTLLYKKIFINVAYVIMAVLMYIIYVKRDEVSNMSKHNRFLNKLGLAIV